MVEPPVELDLGCSAILSGQKIATVAAYQLPELSELSQREVFTNEMGHPVATYCPSRTVEHPKSKSTQPN